MELVGVSLDLEESIAASRHAPMIVEMLGGATMEHVFATPSTLALTVKFTKRMSTFQ